MNYDFSYYVKKYFTEYLPKVRNLASGTMRTYKYHMLDFLAFLKQKNISIEQAKIENFTFELIEDYIVELHERKYNPKTINLKITVLKSFFCYVETRMPEALEICIKIKAWKSLKTTQHLPDHLTTKEVELLLNESTYDLKECAILSLLYDAGLRVQELCQLKVEDLQFRSSLLVQVKKTKNGRARTILVQEATKKILLQYIKQFQLNDNDWLFHNKFGNPYTQKGIAYILEKNYYKAKEKCEDKTMFIPHPHPHILRHSKAVHLVEAGESLVFIRDFLGHLHISSTEIYARLSEQRKREILEKYGKKNPLKIKRTKKEKNTLEAWLKENI